MYALEVVPARHAVDQDVLGSVEQPFEPPGRSAGRLSAAATARVYLTRGGLGSATTDVAAPAARAITANSLRIPTVLMVDRLRVALPPGQGERGAMKVSNFAHES